MTRLRANIYFLIFFLVIVALVVVTASQLQELQLDTRMKAAVEDTALSHPSSTPTSDLQQITKQTRTAAVARVIDGDTFVTEENEHVRLIGIDTPELTGTETETCYGKEAAAYATELLDKNNVDLEFDVDADDRYDRTLAYVWIEERLLNLELVEQGYARAKSYPPNTKYQELFMHAQTDAQAAQRGLWAVCE